MQEGSIMVASDMLQTLLAGLFAGAGAIAVAAMVLTWQQVSARLRGLRQELEAAPAFREVRYRVTTLEVRCQPVAVQPVPFRRKAAPALRWDGLRAAA